VPVVGRLFTSEQFQRNETELVIIVTPYVVRPGMRKKIARARSRAAHTDIKRIVLGRKKGSRVTSPKRLVGPAGFILE
jgi:pilus assembly protein CpaC